MNWKYEVIADDSGQWYGNAVVYKTRAEAEAGAEDLFQRWTAVRKTRVVETDEPANR